MKINKVTLGMFGFVMVTTGMAIATKIEIYTLVYIGWVLIAIAFSVEKE